eukprot:ANDGO_06980.mRNA.1 Histone acetyltransferase of the MYST family 1
MTTFRIGERVLCAFRSGQIAPAEILAVGPKDDWSLAYYVHYIDYNKRLDEWVPPDRIQPFSSSTADFVSSSSLSAAAAAQAVSNYHPTTTTTTNSSSNNNNNNNMDNSNNSGTSNNSSNSNNSSSSINNINSNGNVHSISSAFVGGVIKEEDESRKLTRHQKRRIEEISHSGLDDFDAQTLEIEKEHHDEPVRVKNLDSIVIGKFEIDTWYFSPYPEEYCQDTRRLYLCEFCLKYFKKPKTLERHRGKCVLKHPPGDEIYRKNGISCFEVDGKKQKIYCQNLCLLSKLFLDHKTLYYDVEPFLFYIMCEVDDVGCHIVGYFSKEKLSLENYNLACIMTLPPYQRKGYGKFLISMSYALSKKEDKIGTPERPLSDLGLLSYRSYWKNAILDVLCKYRTSMSINDISRITAIRPDDIISTLQNMGMIKYWKGAHIIAVPPRLLEEHQSRQERNRALLVDHSFLHWTPYVLPQGVTPANSQSISGLL